MHSVEGCELSKVPAPDLNLQQSGPYELNKLPSLTPFSSGGRLFVGFCP